MTLDQGKGHRQWPDGAFAPSETFSPNLPVPINGRPRIKRSGRGACPVPPPRLMGHTPSGLKLVLERITRIDGVSGVHSSFVLRRVVERTSLPVG